MYPSRRSDSNPPPPASSWALPARSATLAKRPERSSSTMSAALVAAVREVRVLYRPDAPVRRLFLDEVTAVADWQLGLKRLLDAGELRDVLVVTTGSRATDLRRGVERLPGRKGRLARTTYLFTPLPYAEFSRVCGETLGSDALLAYLLSGGCPLAAAEIAAHGYLPEFVIEMVRDWVLGECAMSGRDPVRFEASSWVGGVGAMPLDRQLVSNQGAPPAR